MKQERWYCNDKVMTDKQFKYLKFKVQQVTVKYEWITKQIMSDA